MTPRAYCIKGMCIIQKALILEPISMERMIQLPMYNKVAEIAKENNIPFINYNDEMDKIGLEVAAYVDNKKS